MVSPTLNCRPPWVSQKCDTVVDFDVYKRPARHIGCKCLGGQIRTRARFLSESLATIVSPTLNCRPPWGSQMCDTVVDFDVYNRPARNVGNKCLGGKAPNETAISERIVGHHGFPHPQLQNPMGEARSVIQSSISACASVWQALSRSRL